MIFAEGGGRVIATSNTVNTTEYLYIIKRRVLTWFNSRHERDYIFQQDGAPAHTAQDSMDFLEERGIPQLNWPSGSPDLSPIENVWKLLKDALGKRGCPKNVDELLSWVENIWDDLCERHCPSLYASMDRRCEAVIANKGAHTKY